MKSHITNIYGMSNSNTAALQNQIANIGRRLQFLELGLYKYNVETDTHDELAKRIDGIIASVEPGDVAVVQLPTGNGLNFELRLVNRLKASGAKVALLVEDYLPYDQLNYFEGADVAYATNYVIKADCISKGLKEDFINVVSGLTARTEMECENALLNIVTPFFADAYDDKAAISEDVIHVCFGLHDAKGTYSIEVGTVMQSIIENTGAKICFHIFVDDTVSDENRRRLRKIGNSVGDIVKFHLIDVEKVTVDNRYLQNFTIGTMFRLMIPEILHNLHKVIYLDADLLFLKDIKELWDVDIEKYALAAVHDIGAEHYKITTEIIKDGAVDRKKYFNAGVLILNLDIIRSEGNLAERTIEMLNQYKDSKWPDQDALNLLFKDETLLIDGDWNTFVNFACMLNMPFKKRVYHYAGRRFVDFENRREWDDEYIRIKNSLQWNDNIHSDYGRAYNCLKDKFSYMQKLIKMDAEGRKKILIGNRGKAMDLVLDLFKLRKDDYFVACDNPVEGYLQKDISSVGKEEKGKFIILVVPDAFDGKVILKLTEMGFVEGEDFMRLPSLVLASQGGYLL